MSRTILVTMLRDLSEPKHQKYLAAVEALHEVGVRDLPVELAEYFKCTHTSEALSARDDIMTVASFSLSHFPTGEIEALISTKGYRVLGEKYIFGTHTRDGYTADINLRNLASDVAVIQLKFS